MTKKPCTRSRMDMLLEQTNSTPRQGAGLVRLDAAGYRSYSWDRGDVPFADENDEPWAARGFVPRCMAYALNVIVN